MIPVYYRNEQPKRPVGIDDDGAVNSPYGEWTHVDNDVRLTSQIRVRGFVQSQIGST